MGISKSCSDLQLNFAHSYWAKKGRGWDNQEYCWCPSSISVRMSCHVSIIPCFVCPHTQIQAIGLFIVKMRTVFNWLRIRPSQRLWRIRCSIRSYDNEVIRDYMNYELIKADGYGTLVISIVLDCRGHTVKGMITGFIMSAVAIMSVSRVVAVWKIFEMHLRWSDSCLERTRGTSLRAVSKHVHNTWEWLQVSDISGWVVQT